jgi:hypothetical protein
MRLCMPPDQLTTRPFGEFAEGLLCQGLEIQVI